MQKHRASRACDMCKRRKIRCTGKLPCAHCIKNKRTCEYKAPYTRGALPEIKSASVEEQKIYLEEAGYMRPQNWRAPSEEETRNTSLNTTNSPFSATSEHARHNLNTKYDRLKKNPVFAYGDPPLLEMDSSFMILPSRDLAQALIERYFEIVSATSKVLHQPTVERWSQELLSNLMDMRTSAEKNSQRAVVIMVFASAQRYMTDGSQEHKSDSSFLYFQAADNQLAKEKGEIRLATLQARLLQCMYLLSRARINHCYSIFGTIVNSIYSLGIHREKLPSNKTDFLELEMQKRVFWGAYVMDKYLSSALGRPQFFHDEDIDKKIPFMVVENTLSANCLEKTGEGLNSPMKGAVYQIKLSQIVGKVLRKLYTIQRIPLETRLTTASELTLEYQHWRLETSHFLDIGLGSLLPYYQRQSLALRLSYSHALIVLYRPFLLDSIDRNDDHALILRANLDGNVRACLDAALAVIKVIDGMHRAEEVFNASWFSHFCAYTAIVAIFVHIIRDCTQTISIPHSASGPPAWKPYFEAALKCQEQIMSSSDKANESFAKKCSVVLEELRGEALEKIRQANRVDTPTVARKEDENPLPGVEEDGMGRMHDQVQSMSNGGGFFDGGWWGWDTIDFNQTNSGEVYSVFNGLDGISFGDGGSLVDVIDRWGFSSVTGY